METDSAIDQSFNPLQFQWAEKKPCTTVIVFYPELDIDIDPNIESPDNNHLNLPNQTPQSPKFPLRNIVRKLKRTGSRFSFSRSNLEKVGGQYLNNTNLSEHSPSKKTLKHLLLSKAKVQAAICYLTHPNAILPCNFMETFFLTFPLFTTAENLCISLFSRFFQNDMENLTPIQIPKLLTKQSSRINRNSQTISNFAGEAKTFRKRLKHRERSSEIQVQSESRVFNTSPSSTKSNSASKIHHSPENSNTNFFLQSIFRVFQKWLSEHFETISDKPNVLIWIWNFINLTILGARNCFIATQQFPNESYFDSIWHYQNNQGPLTENESLLNSSLPSSIPTTTFKSPPKPYRPIQIQKSAWWMRSILISRYSDLFKNAADSQLIESEDFKRLNNSFQNFSSPSHFEHLLSAQSSHFIFRYKYALAQEKFNEITENFIQEGSKSSRSEKHSHHRHFSISSKKKILGIFGGKSTLHQPSITKRAVSLIFGSPTPSNTPRIEQNEEKSKSSSCQDVNSLLVSSSKIAVSDNDFSENRNLSLFSIPSIRTPSCSSSPTLRRSRCSSSSSITSLKSNSSLKSALKQSSLSDSDEDNFKSIALDQPIETDEKQDQNYHQMKSRFKYPDPNNPSSSMGDISKLDGESGEGDLLSLCLSISTLHLSTVSRSLLQPFSEFTASNQILPKYLQIPWPRICSVDIFKKMRPLLSFNFTPIQVAVELTQIDYEIFQKIRPAELLIKPLHPVPTDNLNLMIKRFDYTSHLVVTDILSHKTPELRAKCIEFYIQVASFCHEFHDYFAVFALMAALENSAINRLYGTWHQISKGFYSKFQSLETLTSSTGSWKVYREELLKLGPGQGCIPFLGVFMTDLTFIEEGNKTFTKDFVNFQKIHRVSSIISILPRFQRKPPNFPTFVVDQLKVRVPEHILEKYGQITARSRKSATPSTVTVSPPRKHLNPPPIVKNDFKNSNSPDKTLSHLPQSESENGNREIQDSSILMKNSFKTSENGILIGTPPIDNIPHHIPPSVPSTMSNNEALPNLIQNDGEILPKKKSIARNRLSKQKRRFSSYFSKTSKDTQLQKPQKPKNPVVSRLDIPLSDQFNFSLSDKKGDSGSPPLSTRTMLSARSLKERSIFSSNLLKKNVDIQIPELVPSGPLPHPFSDFLVRELLLFSPIIKDENLEYSISLNLEPRGQFSRTMSDFSGDSTGSA